MLQKNLVLAGESAELVGMVVACPSMEADAINAELVEEVVAGQLSAASLCLEAAKDAL
jgi:hypothetical protein